MSAQTVESEPQHGTLAAYTWHYRSGVPMDDECRAASSRYQREHRAESRKARKAPVSVVPFGWPCRDCTWTERVPTPDGRIISWREVRCLRHRGAW